MTIGVGVGTGLGLWNRAISGLSAEQIIVKNLFDTGVLTSALDDYTQQETRASEALDFDGSSLANDVIARRDIELYPGKNVSEVFVEQEVIRINDADISVWTKGGAGAANATVTTLGSYKFRISWNGSGGAANIRYPVSVTSGTTHTIGVRIRLISGSITAADKCNYGLLDNALSGYWIKKDMYSENLTDEWKWVSGSGATADVAGFHAFTFGSGNTFEIEVEYVQLTESTHRMRFVPGTGDTVTKEPDVLRAMSVGYVDTNSLVAKITLFEHLLSASQTTFPKITDAGTRFQPQGSSLANAWRSTIGNVQGTQAGPTVVNTPQVLVNTWDHAGGTFHKWYLDGSYIGEGVTTGAPAHANPYVGTQSSPTRELNGSIILLRANKVLILSEIEALNTVLTEATRTWSF